MWDLHQAIDKLSAGQRAQVILMVAKFERMNNEQKEIEEQQSIEEDAYDRK